MKATFLYIFLFCALFFAIKVKADANILINELLPDAVGTDTGKEYVELINITLQDISIKDWYFINTSQTGSAKKIILPDSLVNANSYFVIAEDLSILNITNGISIGSGKLALYNDFGKLQLFNSAGSLVNEVNYGDSKEGVAWDLDGPICNNLNYSTINTAGLKNSTSKAECNSLPISYASANNFSINKVLVSLDGLNWTDTTSTNLDNLIYFKYLSNQDVEVTEVIFKDNSGKELTNPYKFTSAYNANIHVEVTYNGIIYTAESMNIDIHNNISNNVLITEVYPSPESPDQEWLEIYNNDNSDIELANYYIEERTTSGISNKRLALKQQIIHPNQYYVIYENEFNVSLNNSGDAIYLVDLYGNQIDIFTYTETNKSESIGKKLLDGKFSTESYKTLTPTPNTENQFGDSYIDKPQVNTYSINQISDLDSGTEFLLFANINNYIDKYIFINDSTGSLKAKLTNKITEDYTNTYAKFNAKVVTSAGVKNIVINPDTIEIIEYLNPEYNLLDLNIIDKGSIGNNYYINGIIKEIYSNRIKVETANGLVAAYTNSYFEAGQFAKGQSILIQGTLDYYRGNYRLILSDFSVAQVESINTVFDSPLSYSSKAKVDLVSQPISSDYSPVYLVVFAYISIGLIITYETYRSRKTIIKTIKGYIRNINMINKPVIKY